MATLAQPMRSRSLAGQPIAQTPLQAPNLPQTPQAPPFNFQPTTVGPAPTPTASAPFTPPSLPGGMDPYQWRVDQANKGAQRSAAARGTLLSGGFQTALAKLNQGLASQEADKIFDRSATTYGINQNAAHQNYADTLAGYSAGTGAQLDAGRLNLAGTTAGYDRAYGAGRDAYGDARDAAMTQTGVNNANQQAQNEFAQLMEQYRAEQDAQRAADAAHQNDATSAMQRRPLGPSLGYRQPYVLR